MHVGAQLPLQRVQHRVAPQPARNRAGMAGLALAEDVAVTDVAPDAGDGGEPSRGRCFDAPLALPLSARLPLRGALRGLLCTLARGARAHFPC